jgi:hypothetical protein
MASMQMLAICVWRSVDLKSLVFHLRSSASSADKSADKAAPTTAVDIQRTHPQMTQMTQMTQRLSNWIGDGLKTVGRSIK